MAWAIALLHPVDIVFFTDSIASHLRWLNMSMKLYCCFVFAVVIHGPPPLIIRFLDESSTLIMVRWWWSQSNLESSHSGIDTQSHCKPIEEVSSEFWSERLKDWWQQGKLKSIWVIRIGSYVPSMNVEHMPPYSSTEHMINGED